MILDIKQNKFVKLLRRDSLKLRGISLDKLPKRLIQQKTVKISSPRWLMKGHKTILRTHILCFYGEIGKINLVVYLEI